MHSRDPGEEQLLPDRRLAAEVIERVLLVLRLCLIALCRTHSSVMLYRTHSGFVVLRHTHSGDHLL
jgi:exoribonuclease II